MMRWVTDNPGKALMFLFVVLLGSGLSFWGLVAYVVYRGLKLDA